METRWTRVANISFADAGSVSFPWWSQPGIILRGKDASCSMLSLMPTRSYTATCKTGMPFIVSRRHAANPPKDDTHHSNDADTLGIGRNAASRQWIPVHLLIPMTAATLAG